MRSAVGAALCAVRMQHVLKVEACIHASVFVHACGAACQPQGCRLWQLSQSAPACILSVPAVLYMHCSGCIHVMTEVVSHKEVAWGDGMQ